MSTTGEKARPELFSQAKDARIAVDRQGTPHVLLLAGIASNPDLSLIATEEVQAVMDRLQRALAPLRVRLIAERWLPGHYGIYALPPQDESEQGGDADDPDSEWDNKRLIRVAFGGMANFIGMGLGDAPPAP